MTEPVAPVRIVAIDDDPAMTEYFSTYLQAKGYVVFEANRGTDGIRMVREKHPDMILLDLNMPDMDGWKVCQQIRLFCAAPILIVSAFDDPAQVASALDAGADDYLTKPVTNNMLIARLNKLARRMPRQNLVVPTAAHS